MKINFKNILVITKKELRTYFDSPTAYIVLVIFLLLWEFLFFRNAFLVGESSLRMLFQLLPWLFLLLIPALTMGSISQEKSEGTLEFLLTHPLKDIEFLIGKFLGSTIFVALGLLLILPLAISFNNFGKLDWGVVLGQYLGSVSMAMVIISVGIFVSGFFKNQIVSLITSVVISLFLLIAGFELITASVSFSIASILEKLSVLSHFESMARGVIDLRDIWYFVSTIIIFLSLSYLFLLKRKFGNRKSYYRNYQVGIALFIGIAVLVNVVGERIPGRFDLTQNRLYTLSQGTKNTLSELDDVLNINVYASKELPAQFQPVLRDTRDILGDYQTLSKGNLKVHYKDPASSTEISQEAVSQGVQEIQFSVIGQEEFQVKKGYLGLSVSYAGEHESIPFIQNTSDLEYQLTSFIKKLTTTDKKKIAFLTGHGEKGLYSEYTALQGEVSKQFELSEVTIDEENLDISTDIDVLVIAGPSQEIDDKTKEAIQKYLDSGKSVLFLIDTVTIDLQSLNVLNNANSLANLVKENYGVAVQSDLVYDLRSNETVNFGGGMVNYLLSYPFWARAVTVSEDSVVTSRIESIVFPWASSINLDESKIEGKNFKATKLFTTTKFGGKQSGSFSITPNQALSQDNLAQQLIAVGLSNENSNQRIIVVGDSEFLSDQFIRNTPENLVFGMSSLSWLGQEESLAGIQLKQRSNVQLLFEDETQMSLVKYGNMAIVFFVPVLFGAFRLWKRRNLQKSSYSSK